MTEQVHRLPLLAIAVASALSIGAVAALAQTNAPGTTAPGSSTSPASPPSASDLTPQSGPAARPVPTTPPDVAPRSTTAPGSPTAAADLVGMTVVDKSGKNIGSVTKVNRLPSGTLDTIEISTGGFLGIGAKTHTITADRFQHVGQQVVLRMQQDELN